MSVKTVTHLNFAGQARAALAFYHSVFGGEISLVSYQSAGAEASVAEPEHIMWGQVASNNGFTIMAYDVQRAKPLNPGENAFYVVLRGDTVAEITALWQKLVVGAHILVPLQPSAWGPAYGMVTDPFGITWVMDVAA